MTADTPIDTHTRRRHDVAATVDATTDHPVGPRRCDDPSGSATRATSRHDVPA